MSVVPGSKGKGASNRRGIPVAASTSPLMRGVFVEINTRRFTVAELARRAGIPRETIYRWAKGFSPRLSDLEAVMVVLNKALYIQEVEDERRVVDAGLCAGRAGDSVGGTRVAAEALSDEEFLQYMMSCAEEAVYVTAANVNRLKALAGYAETAHPLRGWRGIINKTETFKAVGRARARIAKDNVRC